MAEKIPGWVERLLIPTLESKVRGIVSEEVGHLEKVLEARFEDVHPEIRRVDEKIGSLEKRLDENIGSLEKRFPTVQEIAEGTALPGRRQGHFSIAFRSCRPSVI